MSRGKKALKITGLSLLFLVTVVGLLAAAIFVYAHVETQNYKRDITVQVEHFNDRDGSDGATQLRAVPFGELINPAYKQVKELEKDYQRFYASCVRYYTDKNNYEAETKAYNEARQKGENPKGGEELSEQYDELEKSREQLNKDIEELKEKFNNI